ncbi:dienelactone hydrolase family protein [Perlucidibaca piscinae]|uniref:dienelactone hydrolase family protein n=1 Tax=Perlucidibaca piscinae TaxID=392589 RepID=UPI0003F977EA|nr:dienelactone hydrolase family protein [Perlucidibaca piscinae]
MTLALNQFGLRPLEADSTVSRHGMGRRQFLVSSLATGFALASSPVLAQAIKTDSKGLVAGEVSVPVAGGSIPAYRAAPAKAGKYPVILVIQEIFGVHEYIKDVCRRLAHLGYYAIAPELFARQGDVSKLNDIGEIFSQVVSKVPDAQVFADLDASLAFARASGRADSQRAGVIGFCYGGRMTWLYARHNPSIKAGVSYYGLLGGQKSEIKPADPLDVASEIKAPVLGLYAGSDAYVPDEQVERMRAALQQSGSGSDIVVFPGLNHGFHADYRPTYDKAAANYAWKLTRNWFRDHGL